jgi:hypothetical protein
VLFKFTKRKEGVLQSHHWTAEEVMLLGNTKYGQFAFEQHAKYFLSKNSRIATAIAYIAEAETFRDYYSKAIASFEDSPSLTDEQWNVIDAHLLQVGKLDAAVKIFMFLLDDDAPRENYKEYVEELKTHFLAHIERHDSEGIVWDYNQELSLFATI